eukprot:2629131-Pleurochrysis_carterae.AAC.1
MKKRVLITCVGRHGVEFGQLLQHVKFSAFLRLFLCAPLLSCGAAAIASASAVRGLLADANFLVLVKAHRFDFECITHECGVHVVQVDTECDTVAEDR